MVGAFIAAAGVATLEPEASGESSVGASSGQSGATCAPRDVKERMATLKERLAQKWQVKEVHPSADMPKQRDAREGRACW